MTELQTQAKEPFTYPVPLQVVFVADALAQVHHKEIKQWNGEPALPWPIAEGNCEEKPPGCCVCLVLARELVVNCSASDGHVSFPWRIAAAGHR